MRMLTPKEQAAFLNEVLESWAEETEAVLKQQLRERAGHVPEETIRLLHYRLLLATSSNVSASFHLYFQDSGRHVEMKRLNYQRPLPASEIIDWVMKKGLTRKRRKALPGYKKGARVKLSERQKAERIAYAIAFSKGKTRKRRKKSRWYNKYIYGRVTNLIRRIIREQGDYLANALKAEAENALRNG